MKRLTILGAVLLILTATLITMGCGGSNDRFTPERAEDVTAQGTMLCYQCHADAVNPAELDVVFGNSPAAIANGLGWFASPHANNETWGAPPATDFEHVGGPDYDFHGSWEDDVCGACHDQQGDGRTFDDYYAETGDTAVGIVERPVVGCEACHGSGYGHMAVAQPGPDQCASCHENLLESHLEHHPEANHIVSNYKSSPHANSTNVYGISVCSRCHTNEGAQAYIGIVNGTEDVDDISYALSAQSDIEDPTAVQCATCHEAHTLELLGELSDAGDGTWSAQFKTCTSCHQLYDENGEGHDAYHDGWTPDVLIIDTHIEVPGTMDADDDYVIEGYIVNAASVHDPEAGNTNNGVCLDCHNPHNADNTINREWASSAHGGNILDTADPMTGIVNVTTDNAPAWTSSHVSIGPGSVCNRCHTSTGYRNFANDTANYDANNDEISAGGAREMLYCWACHTDNVGGFRNPGIFNSTIADYTAPAGRIDAVGDIGASSICMACHKGRKSGNEATAAVDGTNTTYSSVDGHYLAAGGIMYRTTGYEFVNSVGGEPLDYSNYSYYGHIKIGTSDCSSHGTPCQDDLLEGGPCVGCHMKDSDVGHTLKVVEKNAEGAITGLPANDEVCSNCHSGDYALTASDLEHDAEAYREALLAFANTLDGAGFAPVGVNLAAGVEGLDGFGYPYFGGYGPSDWSTAADPTGEVNLGAMFNFSMLMHEPGAFTHNSRYTKRLIFDSIDWLDGDTKDSDSEIMDGYIDLTGFDQAYEWFIGHADPAPAITNVPRP